MGFWILAVSSQPVLQVSFWQITLCFTVHGQESIIQAPLTEFENPNFNGQLSATGQETPDAFQVLLDINSGHTSSNLLKGFLMI